MRISYDIKANYSCHRKYHANSENSLQLREKYSTTDPFETGAFCIHKHRGGDTSLARGEFRPRQTTQLPRAVDLKGRLLSCQSY